jgi:two-component system C4-dicarboxylate transport sensor histidine kinase DctB
VPPELRDRITEPFFTTKQNGESLGLGLSISRALLEEFGGTLRFVEAGSGTAVVVSLPLMTHERQAAE